MDNAAKTIAHQAAKHLPQVKAVSGYVKRAIYAYLLDVTDLATPDARQPSRKPVTFTTISGSYVTPHYLAAALGVDYKAVVRGFRELMGVIPELTILGAETRVHEFSPMTLTAPLDCEWDEAPLRVVRDGEDVCPYGGLVAHRKTGNGPEVAYHNRIHKGDMVDYLGYDYCPFEMFYDPVTNPEATEIGCRAIHTPEDAASGCYTIRMCVPTPKGKRRWSVSHTQFHAFYPDVFEKDCPFTEGHVDRPEYPWSDLNPVNQAELQEWLREQGEVPAAQSRPEGMLGRLQAFLTAPTVAEGLQRALHD